MLAARPSSSPLAVNNERRVHAGNIFKPSHNVHTARIRNARVPNSVVVEKDVANPERPFKPTLFRIDMNSAKPLGDVVEESAIHCLS